MKSLKLSFYNEFMCLANKCTYTCCMDWGIHMTPEEVERLHKYYGDRLDIHEDGSATLKFGKEGTCELMSPEGLCTLYLMHGVNGICAICDTYPRFSTEYNDLQEFHLSNGCEGVLSYFMKLPGLSFVEDDSEPFKTMGTVYPKENIMVAARDHAVLMMQMQDIPVWSMLYLVLKFAEAVHAGGDIEQLVKDFGNETTLKMMADQLESIPDNYGTKFGMFHEMLTAFLSKVNDKHSYELNIKELEPEIDRLLDGEDALRPLYEGFDKDMERYETYFRNVCANYLYTHLEYMFDRDMIEDCVRVLLLQYGVTRMAAFLKWKRNGGYITDLELMHITAFFARMMEHGIVAMAEFMDNNVENQWFTDAGFLIFMR